MQPSSPSGLRNRLVLRAVLVERGSLRFSPAGVPLLDAALTHASAQPQAGTTREVELAMPALFAGSVAERADRIALGSELLLSGFLAPKRKASKLLTLNVTEFELIEV